MSEIEFEVFVKSVPCPCSPGLSDRKAEQVFAVLEEVKARLGSAMTYKVHALNNLAAFRANEQMSALLRDEGHAALPVFFLNGELVSKGTIPDADTLAQAAE